MTREWLPYLSKNSERNKLTCFVYLGLQMTDVELDERVTALEENGGNSENDKANITNFPLFKSELN